MKILINGIKPQGKPWGLIIGIGPRVEVLTKIPLKKAGLVRLTKKLKLIFRVSRIKLILIGIFLFGFSNISIAQKDYNALNLFVQFGSTSRINANYEITVGKSISLAPSIAMPFDFEWLALGGRADLYIDSLFHLNWHWDIWLGVDTGIIINGDDNFSANAHAGVEYKLTNFIGVIAEIGGGTASSGGIGLGFHF